MIYNNSSPGETREAPCLLHTGGRKHQQLQTDDIHEPENGSRRQNENNYFTSIITGTRAEIASCAQHAPGMQTAAASVGWAQISR